MTCKAFFRIKKPFEGTFTQIEEDDDGMPIKDILCKNILLNGKNIRTIDILSVTINPFIKTFDNQREFEVIVAGLIYGRGVVGSIMQTRLNNKHLRIEEDKISIKYGTENITLFIDKNEYADLLMI